ncbi:unnamed protein product [Paramecium octaurelia]|uniref:Uncharacterized protein n=1 Tax=Paramecium octaurelia TaxID=43137 RepID=A0A8S1YJ03_PAROT|nr:unnamed protein product [Paramecium octaurelia]
MSGYLRTLICFETQSMHTQLLIVKFKAMHELQPWLAIYTYPYKFLNRAYGLCKMNYSTHIYIQVLLFKVELKLIQNTYLIDEYLYDADHKRLKHDSIYHF